MRFSSDVPERVCDGRKTREAGGVGGLVEIRRVDKLLQIRSARCDVGGGAVGRSWKLSLKLPGRKADPEQKIQRRLQTLIGRRPAGRVRKGVVWMVADVVMLCQSAVVGLFDVMFELECLLQSGGN